MARIYVLEDAISAAKKMGFDNWKIGWEGRDRITLYNIMKGRYGMIYVGYVVGESHMMIAPLGDDYEPVTNQAYFSDNVGEWYAYDIPNGKNELKKFVADRIKDCFSDFIVEDVD